MAILVAAASSVALFGLAWSRASDAVSRANAAALRLASVREDADEVRHLRAREERIAVSERPSHDVIARVGGSLAEVGLPESRLKSVTPVSDRGAAGSGSAHRVQSVRIVLEPMTLAELGPLLRIWRREHSLWTTSGVELNTASRGRDPEEAYRVTITVSAVYLADAGRGVQK